VPGPVFALLLAVLLVLPGCRALGTTSTEIANDVLPVSPLIPDYRLPVSPSLSIPMEALIAGALVYLYVDPLAPNWQLEERRLSADLVHIVLRKKRITTGGDGEAAQIIRRRATDLAIKGGFSRYEMVEYAEAVESETMGARKVTTALVRLSNEPRWRIP